MSTNKKKNYSVKKRKFIIKEGELIEKSKKTKRTENEEKSDNKEAFIQKDLKKKVKLTESFIRENNSEKEIELYSEDEQEESTKSKIDNTGDPISFSLFLKSKKKIDASSFSNNEFNVECYTFLPDWREIKNTFYITERKKNYLGDSKSKEMEEAIKLENNTIDSIWKRYQTDPLYYFKKGNKSVYGITFQEIYNLSGMNRQDISHTVKSTKKIFKNVFSEFDLNNFLFPTVTILNEKKDTNTYHKSHKLRKNYGFIPVFILPFLLQTKKLLFVNDWIKTCQDLYSLMSSYESHYPSRIMSDVLIQFKYNIQFVTNFVTKEKTISTIYNEVNHKLVKSLKKDVSDINKQVNLKLSQISIEDENQKKIKELEQKVAQLEDLLKSSSKNS